MHALAWAALPQTLPRLTRQFSRAPPTALARARRKPRQSGSMRVAVVGCAHGELDAIYAAVQEAERAAAAGAVELVICPGDFEAVRNEDDLMCMACPDKFKDMRSFYKYYSGESVAPVPTVFVGGNHEASNHLQEIPFGGLVAPNMYYLGNAGVVTFRGLRIGGVSGVYTEHNYAKERVERPPYPRSEMRSVYHTRREDVERLMRLSRPLDVFVSHDWPKGITEHGDLGRLLQQKPFLKTEIMDGRFGNPGTAQLLAHLQPRFWFAAHMHVKFPALVRHAGSGKETKFLALDKVLPRRDFVQIIDIAVGAEETNTSSPSDKPTAATTFDLDAEWLAVLQTDAATPGRQTPVTYQEMRTSMLALETAGVQGTVRSPDDFFRNAPVYDKSVKRRGVVPKGLQVQPFTERLAAALGLPCVGSENAAAPAAAQKSGAEDGTPFLAPQRQ